VITEEEEKKGVEVGEDDDEDYRWDTTWMNGMKPYREQLHNWQQLQDYDTQVELDMVTKSDYKLDIYNNDY